MKINQPYESSRIDKYELSQKALKLELEKGIKYIPHSCPGCGGPASIASTGSSFCRDEECILKGWRF